MATLTKTLFGAAATDPGSWASVPGASVVMTPDVTTDSDTVAGHASTHALETKISGRNKSAASQWQWSGTWQDLGIPAGSIVTDVQLIYDWRCSQYTTGATSSVGIDTLTDSSGANSINLELGSAPFGSAFSWGTLTGIANVAVPTAIQPAGSSIRLNLNNNLATGASNSAVVTLHQTYIQIVMTYTPGATQINGSDTGAGTDAATEVAQLADSDSAAGSDPASMIAALAGADSAVASAAATLLMQLADSGAGADLGAMIAALAGSDTATGLDLGVLVSLLAAADAAAGADGAAFKALAATADAASGVDAASAATSPSFADSGAGIETPLVVPILNLADAAAGADGLAAQVLPALADIGNGVDGVTTAGPLGVADTGTGLEAALLAVLSALAESGAGADGASPRVGLSLADIASGADAGTVGVPISGADVGAGVDLLTALRSLLDLSDSGLGADNSSFKAAFVVGNVATGVDGAAISTPGQIMFGDGGSGVEGVSVIVRLAVSDSASGSEILLPSRIVVLSEPAAGSDLATAIALAQLLDGAAGAENVSMPLAGFDLLDAAGGADDLSVGQIFLAVSDDGSAIDIIDKHTGEVIGTVRTGKIVKPRSGSLTNLNVRGNVTMSGSGRIERG